MPVTYALKDHVAVITFDDGKANAYTHEVLDALTDALQRSKDDSEARALLLVGRPGRFSAGLDLATMNASAESRQDMLRAGAHFVARLLIHPSPVVAACTGHAVAAGALVLLACDYRIGASGDWRLGLNEVSIGITVPTWAVELARYRMPPSEFDLAVVLGRMGGPEEALRAGILDRVVAPDDVISTATEMARELAELQPEAVAGTKARARADLARVMLAGLDEDLIELAGPTS
jgi:enoyl-CoA hydratase